jgi:C4-dicarboxylate transporter, DctM subunit
LSAKRRGFDHLEGIMKSLFHFADKAVDNFLKVTAIASVVLMLLLATFIGLQVLARNIFGINIRGLFDLSSYSLIIFSFISAAYTLKEKSHISVDILINRIPAGAKPGLEILIYSISLLFSVTLGYSAMQWAASSFSSGLLTISDIPIKKGYLISAMALGSLFLILQIFRIIGDRIVILSSSSSPSAASPVSKFKYNSAAYILAFIAVMIICLLSAIYVNIMLGLGLLALVLLFSGMPVFIALGTVGSLGLYLMMGTTALRQIPFFAYQVVDSFPLTCLPLFIIAGIILEKGKVVEKLFFLFQMFTGNFHAAPLVTTILVGGFFCAISGSSVATTSIIAAVSLPILVKSGYRKSLSSGVVAGSTIGTVIPPSIGYILYGIITNESIGQLFMAGLIPGAIIFGLYCLYVIIRGIVDKQSLFENRILPVRLEAKKPSLKEKLLATKDALWGISAPVFVLGGIYTGIFTPSEAAAVMVVYSVLVTVVIMKTLTWRELIEGVLVAVKISSMILLIIIGARIFGAVISQQRIAADLVSFAGAVDLSPLATLGIVSITLFIFGMFLDSASIMVIMLPVFHPLIMSVGYDSVWFGVFFIVMLEIGLLTPPVGLNLFLIYGISKFRMEEVIKGALPFLLILLLSLGLFVLFPQIVTWLPQTMVK